MLNSIKLTYEEDDPAVCFSFINCIYLGSARRKTNPEVVYESRVEGHKRTRTVGFARNMDLDNIKSKTKCSSTFVTNEFNSIYYR